MQTQWHSSRVTLATQVVPSRKVRKAGQPGKASVGLSGQAAGNDDESDVPFDPDVLLPRTDISSQITSKLISDIGSANWKERNAALDDVESIIKSAGSRIQPSIGDLMSALKVTFALQGVVLLGMTQSPHVAIVNCNSKFHRPKRFQAGSAVHATRLFSSLSLESSHLLQTSCLL